MRVINADVLPNMQTFGRKMKEDLPPEFVRFCYFYACEFHSVLLAQVLKNTFGL